MSTAPPEDEDNDRSHLVMRMTAHTPRRSISHWLTGRPLSTADASHETIGKTVGLAVFASDALSSSAYATMENTLHMNTADILRKELLNTPGIVITDLPYQVSKRKERQ